MKYTILDVDMLPQKGFVPNYILIAVLVIIGLIGTLAIYNHSQSQKQSSTIQKLETASPSASLTATSSSASKPSPKILTTVAATKKPIPTSSAKVNPITSPIVNNTNNTPKNSCTVNVLYNKLDGSGFDNALSVTLVASYSSSDNSYLTGAQWDFDGNGSWDTDMKQSNQNIEHTYDQNGSYTVKLHLQGSDGNTTDVCSNSLTVPNGITVKLTGQVYSDDNCNYIHEPNEKGLPGVTVSIYKMPENSVYATVTSDSNGYYSFSQNISASGNLNIEPGAVAISGYKAPYTPHGYDLDGAQSSVNEDLPQVPNEDVGFCK